MPDEKAVMMTDGEKEAAAKAAEQVDPVVATTEGEELKGAEAAEVAGEKQPGEKEETEKPHKKGGFVRKIERLEIQLEERDRRIEELMNRVAGKPAETAKPVTDADVKPVLANFQTYEEFVEALAAYTVRQETRKLDEKTAKSIADEQAKEITTQYNEKVLAFKETHEDFDEVLTESVPIYEGVRMAIIEMENGPDVAYFLGKNPDVAKKLMEFTPLRAVAEVGKISASLSKPETPVKKRAAAPAPITPVSGSTGSSPGDPNKMSVTEYRRWRQEQHA